MAKVGVKDLATALAKKKNMSVADAETYIETFFALINETLVPDKIVKVKGLGTFKLVDVRDRESVDVNTGERVVIDGHSKMSFVPDATLKDLVNKPFSQFETVVLNDGVDFDNDTVADNAEMNEREPTVSDKPGINSDSSDLSSNNVCSALSDAVSVLQKQDVDAPVNSEQDLEKEDDKPEENPKHSDIHSEESIEPVVSDNTSVNTEDKDKVISTEMDEDSFAVDKEPDVAESEQCDSVNSSTSNDKAELQIETTVVPENDNNGEEKPHVAESTSIYDIPNENKKKSGAIKLIYSFAVLVFVCAAFFSGYYFGENNSSKVDVVKQKQQIVKAAVKQNSVKARSPKIKENIDSVPSKKLLAEKNAEQKELKPEVDKKEVADDAVNQDIPAELHNAKRMVETGAYVIDGLDKSVVVKSGQNVKSISRQYLGEGMECYIQLYNRKIDFKTGETVNIPKLRLKKKTSNKKVS